MSKKKSSTRARALVFGLSFIVISSILDAWTSPFTLAITAMISSAITKGVQKAFMEEAESTTRSARPVRRNDARQDAADWGRRNSESMARSRARYEAQARAKMDARQQEEAELARAEAEAKAKAAAEAKAKADAEAKAKAKAAEEAKAKEARAKVDPNDNSPAGIVARGKDMLWQIREANDAIPDAELTKQLSKLETRCEKIFQTVQERPDKAPMVRKFLSYYLPTTLNMLSNYRLMQDRGVAEDEMTEVHTTLVRGLDMILGACRKLQTNLYRENMMDVAADMNVLEQMLVRDGLSDGTSSFPILGGNASATAEALNHSGAPIMDFSDVDDRFEEIAQNQTKSAGN